MEFFATCAGGLEQLLADELRELRCGQVRPLKGQVAFAGTLEDAYRACLWSRIASRVVAVLARVDAHDSDALYKSVAGIDWTSHLGGGVTLGIDAHGTNDELRDTRFVALRVKDAISDTLFAARGSRPVLDVRSPDLMVVVRIVRDRATIGIDLAGEPLFHRGYGAVGKTNDGLSSLRSDYAAALVSTASKLSAASDDEALLVLYPGTGALLVEAAAAALDRAPGLLHERWGMTGWLNHDQLAWEDLLAEAHERAQAGSTRDARLFVYDPRRGASESCAHLLRAAGMDVRPQFLAPAELPVSPSRIVADLSWLSGIGLAEQVEVLGALASARRATEKGALVALASNAVVDRAVGEKPAHSRRVKLGRDELELRGYLIDGPQDARASVKLGEGKDVPVFVPASDQFAARLTKVAKQRAAWAEREYVSCYRVYDADLPDYAVSIDLFEGLSRPGRATGRWLSIYEYAPPKGVDTSLAHARLLDVLAIAPRVLGVQPRDVFVRTRVRARGGSQYANEAQALGRPERGGGRGERRRDRRPNALPPGAHLIDENGLTFEVNFSQRLDCGIFLDHRDTRSMLREMAKGMKGNGHFLNLFAYTGTGTCYAADGGAKHTTTVDLSRPTLDWARRNMARNGFEGPEHEFVPADVLSWVREQRRGRLRWDLIFCDVPTFSNSNRMRKASFDVQRDHVELLISVSRLLTRADEHTGWEGGTCVFSCNLRSFRPDVQALAKAGVSIEDITKQTIPEDFERNPKIHHCYLVRRTR